MQVPITIEKKLFSIKTVTEFQGEQVPFEVESYQKDWERSDAGGFFDLSCWGIVEISGPDALDYLQRMSTANLKLLSVGLNTYGAFLTGKGTLIAIGTFLRVEPEKVLFVVSPNSVEKTLTHLDQFHFQERLEIKNRTLDFALVGLWNVHLKDLKLLWNEPREPRLSYFLTPRDGAPQIFLQMREKGLSLLGMHFFHFCRIRAGLPWMGWEAKETELILEAGLDDFVARNKGCYPGQEVVERIFTYGQVNRKLIRVELTGKELDVGLRELAEDIKETKGKVIGTLKSKMADPTKDRVGFGLATIRKEYWGSAEEFQTDLGLKIKLAPVHTEG